MTESDRIRPPEVTDKQSIAIDALVAGATHREAAELAGVQRTTVTEWCNHNAAFIAEWNQRSEQCRIAFAGRLHETMLAALNVVGDSIGEGDTAVALTFFKVVGVKHILDVSRPGPTDPIRVQVDLAEQLRSGLLSDLLVGREFIDIVERRSDESARLES